MFWIAGCRSVGVVACLLLLGSVGLVSGATKVACVGDSITYGAKVGKREWLSYPAQLSRMLGDGYQVENFGSSGATLLKNGNQPYWKKKVYKDALAWQPDVVVIKLGTNDTKAVNWEHKAEFETDLTALARSFMELPGKPKVFLALPVPAFCTGEKIDGDRVRDGVLPATRKVAKALNLPVIDFHSRMLSKKILLPDAVHPNAEGAFELAAGAFEAISGKRYPSDFATMKSVWENGLPPRFSMWKGFKKYDFKLGAAQCGVVAPERAAAGNPWIWRARFFGHEPQTDIALLEQGYHLAYCDVADLFGAPQAVKRWDVFYKFATSELALAEKVVLEGMSRGGLIVFNWTRANPQKVRCIYADAPVCDFKSWPGGKGNGKGDPRSWAKCLKAYGFKDEGAALAFKGNPIDHAAEWANAGIPVLFVYGKADDVVPPNENCEVFADVFRRAGGTVEMIGKDDGGHHPHSLPDPAPIVDFIVGS